MTQPSSIEDVIDAIARFGEHPYAKIYVERRGLEYRWSIAHRGRPYPLLREVEKFLEVPHTSVLVHCTTVDGWTVVALTGPLSSAPEAWAIIDASADKRQIGLLDLDNMAKLVGDALQGSKPGQGKKAHHDERLLPNDKRISLWKMEKRVSNAKIKRKSRLLVQRYTPSWQARTGAARDRVL